MNNKNIIITAVIVAVVFGGGGFYGGMLYGKSQASSAASGARLGQRAGGTGQFGGQGGANSAMRRGTGGSFVGGKIISEDSKSITIQLPTGGSDLVYFADSTQIAKAATGTVSDLVNGAQVMVNGTTNSDGSITAKTIQVR